MKKEALELFILSALSLFLELLIIRWMSADIRAFTVFRTFPLITCFVGLGVGFSLAKNDTFRILPPALLAFAVIMKALDFTGLGKISFPSLATFQWQNLATGLGDTASQGATIAYVTLCMLLVLLVLSIPFGICVSIGSRMGALFNKLEPLPAYCYDILGASFGGIVFSLLCTLRLAPWELLLIPAAIIAIMQWSFNKVGTYTAVASLLIIPAIFLTLPSPRLKPLMTELQNGKMSQTTTTWSPYQRVDVTVFETEPTAAKPKPEFVGLELSANHAFYQYFFNLAADSPLANSALFNAVRGDYALSFALNKPKSALIVGAGTGQNVTSALEAGVKDIDAVEIDPVIIEVGKKYNRDYASSNVRLVCDDARHFFSKCNRKYDVVNFSTLDSQTISGLSSSVRIDAYVYTKQSLEQALSLINPDGIVMVSFSTVAPWSEARLFKTFSAAAGYAPIVLEGKFSKRIFVMGPHVKDGTLQIPADYKKASTNYPSGDRVLTDDWPYLYVRANIVDYPYLLVVAEILILSLYAGRKLLFGPARSSEWQLFFLGAAFMLLELHAISFLSLLYGSTWITSAVVINCILLMILGASIFTIKLGDKINSNAFISTSYALLFISILTSYFLPSDNLSLWIKDNWWMYALVTVLTILPMGLAAIVFASGLKRADVASRAFAFNLFGAVIGSLSEYLSNYCGIKNLSLIALSLYICSYICYLKINGKKAAALSA